MEAASLTLDVVNSSGKKVGSREVSASVFARKENPSLLHQVVRWQRAKRRAGTHKVKTRDEVSGGGIKPWKQKGTGRARAGSNTSPLWVRGGTAHGPKVRSYEFRMNRQERRAALSSVLSLRQNEGRLIVLKGFDLSEVKTKSAQAVLTSLGIPARTKTVVVVSEQDETSSKSLRNIDGVTVLKPAGLNVYDVLKAQYLVVVEEALPIIEARF